MQNPSLKAPLDFTNLVNPKDVGLSEAGVRGILDTFASYFERGLQYGAQLVVARHGQVVVDQARGQARLGGWLRRSMPVQPDTPFHTFSTTKPFTAMCVHKLVEDGLIDLDTPVGYYWPAFGCKGKQTATIRHVLLHQAGIPLRGILRQIPLWTSWRLVTRSVAALPAEYPPGTQTAYHAVNGGFILGEVVRRVSGLPVQDYLQRHFLSPLGMADSSLGLSASQSPRAAGVYPLHRLQILPGFGFAFPPFRRAVIPSASLHSTARDLAVFFQMLVNRGVYAGQRYLQEETIMGAVKMHFEGLDRTTKRPMRWALGFQLGGKPKLRPKFYFFGERSSQRTFGHAGQGSGIAWADLDRGLVFAFTCNSLLSPLDAGLRWQALADAVWAAMET